MTFKNYPDKIQYPHLSMASRTKNLQVNVNVPLILMKEKGKFIAYTPALELSSTGKTAIDARRNFSEALHLFIEELISMGTVDQALTDLGWSKKKEEWKSPIEIENTQSIPFKVALAA